MFQITMLYNMWYIPRCLLRSNSLVHSKTNSYFVGIPSIRDIELKLFFLTCFPPLHVVSNIGVITIRKFSLHIYFPKKTLNYVFCFIRLNQLLSDSYTICFGVQTDWQMQLMWTCVGFLLVVDRRQWRPNNSLQSSDYLLSIHFLTTLEANVSEAYYAYVYMVYQNQCDSITPFNDNDSTIFYEHERRRQQKFLSRQ